MSMVTARYLIYNQIKTGDFQLETITALKVPASFGLILL